MIEIEINKKEKEVEEQNLYVSRLCKNEEPSI